MGLSEDLDVDFARPVPRAHLYLLAVGINRYANRNLKLDCAVNDALECRGLSAVYWQIYLG